MFSIENVNSLPNSFATEFAKGAKFTGLSSEAKADIRNHLLSEQKNRCAYCERHLREDHKTVIEHFHPQNNNGNGGKNCEREIGGGRLSRSDVESGNLLISCDGHKQNQKSKLTCDAQKGGDDICDRFHNPKHQKYSRTLVSVDLSGQIHAERFPSTKEDAQDVIDNILNLNDDYLCKSRKQQTNAWRNQWKAFVNSNSKKSSMADLRKKFADNIRKYAETAEYPSTLESIALRIENVESP